MPQIETLLDLVSSSTGSGAVAPANLLDLVQGYSQFSSVCGGETGPCVGDDADLDDGDISSAGLDDDLRNAAIIVRSGNIPNLLDMVADGVSLRSDGIGPNVGDDAVNDDSIVPVAQLDLGPNVGDDLATVTDLGPCVGDDLVEVSAAPGDLGPCVGDDDFVPGDLGPCVGDDERQSRDGPLDLGPCVGDDGNLAP